MNLLAFDTSTERLSVAVQRADGERFAHAGAGGAQASAALIPAVVAFERRFVLRWGTLRRHLPWHVLASVAYCSEVPVWAVLGVGRCLPDAAFASLVARVGDVRVPWLAEADVVPLGLCWHVVGPLGLVAIEESALSPECPLAHELLT